MALIPLARLRVRNELAELRADDLRFTTHEAAQFLNRAMGLNLSAENISALHARTEGWIAGLQLAALALQGRSDADQFVASFAGSHRFVLDYLVEEVLRRQPEEIQSFLLETAILDRFTGPLCDVVTGQGSGQQTLERLEESNLFIVALDDKRECYRYQHLFADVLSVRLEQTQPERIPELHRRAAGWFEANGLTLEAISHALGGADFDRAVRLITALNQSEPQVLFNWFRSLPDELVRSRPELCLEQAYAFLAMKRFAEAKARLQDAERSAIGVSNPDPDAIGVKTLPDWVPTIILITGTDLWLTSLIPVHQERTRGAADSQILQ